MSRWSGGGEINSAHLVKFKYSEREEGQRTDTVIIPPDSSIWMMALAWPWFQPVTPARVARAFSRSWGFIIMSCPVDRPVHWLPRTPMTLASTFSPMLFAKADEIYKAENENLSKTTPANLRVKTFDSVCTWGSRSVQSVVMLYRTAMVSCGVSWVNAGPGATHRYTRGRLQGTGGREETSERSYRFS